MLYVSSDGMLRWIAMHRKVAVDGNAYVYVFDKPLLSEEKEDMFDDVGIIARSIEVTGRDGKAIRPGDHVYGQDGREWVVDGIGGDPYDVVGHEPSGGRDHMQPLKSAWLTHERPKMTRRQVADRLRVLAEGHGMSRRTVEGKLGQLADELERDASD